MRASVHESIHRESGRHLLSPRCAASSSPHAQQRGGNTPASTAARTDIDITARDDSREEVTADNLTTVGYPLTCRHHGRTSDHLGAVEQHTT